jgi:5-methylcytosine-specific restriction endonuclease McrA
MSSAQVPATLRFEQGLCANCFEPLPQDAGHRPWLFCTQLYADYAKLVRYWRRVSRDGSMETDPQVEYAVKVQIAHLLAGGYDRQARMIPPDTRALVKARDKVCVSCGAPGEETDHIDGPSSDPGNLQLLCKDCHHAKTDANMVPASDDQKALIAGMLLKRVLPEQPAQLSDATAWSAAESKLRAERRLLILGPQPKRRSRSKAPQEFIMLEP